MTTFGKLWIGLLSVKDFIKETIMDWLKARWKERSSQNGVALIAMGVVALVFKPLLGVAAWAAIIYGAWQYWKAE